MNLNVRDLIILEAVRAKFRNPPPIPPKDPDKAPDKSEPEPSFKEPKEVPKDPPQSSNPGRPPKEFTDKVIPKIMSKGISRERAGAIAGDMWYNKMSDKAKAPYERARAKRETKGG